MMNVFLDANVLISVLNKEYPLSQYSSRILSLPSSKFKLFFTSPLCLAIAFYFSEKKSGRTQAKRKIELLSAHLHFTTINQQTIKDALQNKKIHDFEDGLEYYSALESRCVCIITEDTKDFYFSEIEVATCRNFFESYL